MNRLLISCALTAALCAPARGETIAITGGTVHTMGQAGTIENATVVIRDGKIAAVGKDAPIPADARRIDAAGKVVTPGLFNSLTNLGLVEVSAVSGTDDASEKNDRFTAAFDVRYAINPGSMLIPVNRIDGLTRAVVAPAGGAAIIAGMGAVIQLGNGDPLVRTPVAMFASLGESGASIAGGSRAAAILRLREALQDARDFAANRSAFDSGNRREYALSRLDLEALGSVVKGELPLVVTVNRASDILAVLQLRREFGLRLILSEVDEGWKVAREISEAGVPVLVNPLDDLPSTFERIGATLENAARLRAAGVRVAFATGDSHNARNVRQAAGNAVANGMAWDDALASLTIVPAGVWGIAERYGTLEAGKDADVVVWNGDPLEVTTLPEAVIIRGVQMPMKSRQTELRDRYR